MNERIKSEARKIVMATTALASAAFFTACNNSEQNIATPTPHTDFSKNTGDYKYKIVLENGGNPIKLYTNNEPYLDPKSGQNLLIVQDVYCPGLNDANQESFNCNEFVEGTYKISTLKRIIIAPNTQTQ